MKYTKGPWMNRPDSFDSRRQIITNGEKYIATVDQEEMQSIYIVSTEENVGNATLIAAAPTMHLLLETLVERLLVDDMSNYGKDQAEALYAAASFLKTLKGEK